MSHVCNAQDCWSSLLGWIGAQRGRSDGRQCSVLFWFYFLPLAARDLSFQFLPYRIWTSSAETLLKIAYGTKVDVACSAIDAYAAGCFVAEDDMLEILESMEKLKGLWIKGAYGLSMV